MTQFLRRYFTVMFLGFVACAVAHAQEVENTEKASVSVAMDDTEIDTALDPIAPQTAKNTIKVHLQSDGSLSGRLRVNYTSGKMEPADATVAFRDNSGIAETTETNEEGRFTLADLSPGQYTAEASIEEGSTAFYVEVAEYDENVEEAKMFMDATLTPTPDYVTGEIIDGGYMDGGYVDGGCSTCGGEILDSGCATCGETIVDGGYVEEGFVDAGFVDGGYIEEPLYAEEYIVDGGMACGGSCGGGFSGGGCCGGGGGGGFGSLLGLGGLAGLAGLAGLGGNNNDRGKRRPPVSPASPFGYYGY